MNKESLRIVFMGTPDFGIPCLDMMYHEKYNIVSIVTQPDRPAGRGGKVSMSPVKEWAVNHKIPVLQFDKISSEGVDSIRKLKPDLCITAAFGQILSCELLDIPQFGVFNVHASLLPKYRGSAPIQWSIINGEKETGVTIMRTVRKLDAGDIIRQEKIKILSDMNAGILYEQLSLLGAKALKCVLSDLLNDSLEFYKQNEDDSSYFPMFEKGFGLIDFSDSCKRVVDFIRGVEPCPGSYFLLNGIKIKVHKAEYLICEHNFAIGTIVACNLSDGFKIAASDGIVSILEIQMPGKKMLPIETFLLGNHFNVGDIIG